MAPSSDMQSILTPLARQLHLSPTLQINEQVQQRLKQGKQVVHLGFGEATFPLPEAVLEAHREASKVTSYLPVAGLGKLREVSRTIATASWIHQLIAMESLSRDFNRAVWVPLSRQNKWW